jgi:hypothetical protein
MKNLEIDDFFCGKVSINLDKIIYIEEEADHRSLIHFSGGDSILVGKPRVEVIQIIHNRSDDYANGPRLNPRTAEDFGGWEQFNV